MDERRQYYIDTHVHLAKDLKNRYCFEDARAATLVRHMHENNIRYAFVYATYINSDNDMTNEEVKKEVERCRPYLVGVGSVDINNFKETFETAKSFCIDGSFKGLKLYPTYQKYRLNDSRLEELYEFCQDKMVPVIIHIGTCRKTDFKVKPKEVEGLLGRYPGLMIVIAHFGMPYVKQTLELMVKYKDRPVYVDTSCMWPEQDDNFLRKLLNYCKSLGLSSRRILFGTDFPLCKADVMIEQINGSKFSLVEKKRIFYGNAKSLFRITRPYAKGMASKKIAEILVIPTYDCNYECTCCFERSLKRSKRQMSWEDFCRIVKKVKRENVGAMVSFFGGEPTLWPHLKDGISLLKDEGIEVGLYTNGRNRLGGINGMNRVFLHLNCVDKQVRKDFQLMAGGRFRLFGYCLVSRYLDVELIETILKDAEVYDSIVLILDRTEIDIQKNSENFDKAVKFCRYGKIKINNVVPSCQFRQDQKLFMRMNDNVLALGCFPGWESMVIDNDMNLKNCFSSNKKVKFDENISFLEARDILIDENLAELMELPFKECRECFDFQSGACYGGCASFKQVLLGCPRNPVREIP